MAERKIYVKNTGEKVDAETYFKEETASWVNRALRQLESKDYDDAIGSLVQGELWCRSLKETNEINIAAERAAGGREV